MEKFLSFMKNDLNSVAAVALSDFKKEDTVVIFVDMVKGFYNEGPLANEKVGDIIPDLVKLNEKTNGYKKVFFVDSHTEDAMEFKCYPKHCVENTIEEEIIDELIFDKDDKNISIVKKNSVNGFHASGIKAILDDKGINNYIVVGVCTDICVKNFVLTTITYFNEKNLEKKIIVPVNMVETFDADFHNREYWNLTSLFEMKSNGAIIVRDIL